MWVCYLVNFLNIFSQLSVHSQTICISCSSSAELWKAACVCMFVLWNIRLLYIIRHLLIVLWYSILFIFCCCVVDFPATNWHVLETIWSVLFNLSVMLGIIYHYHFLFEIDEFVSAWLKFDSCLFYSRNIFLAVFLKKSLKDIRALLKIVLDELTAKMCINRYVCESVGFIP